MHKSVESVAFVIISGIGRARRQWHRPRSSSVSGIGRARHQWHRPRSSSVSGIGRARHQSVASIALVTENSGDTSLVRRCRLMFFFLRGRRRRRSLGFEAENTMCHFSLRGSKTHGSPKDAHPRNYLFTTREASCLFPRPRSKCRGPFCASIQPKTTSCIPLEHTSMQQGITSLQRVNSAYSSVNGHSNGSLRCSHSIQQISSM